MFNAREVLKRLEILESLKDDFTIEFAYEPLNIFDWFRDTLTRKDINDMIEFLQNAIELGYTGYVCFKVGDTDTASGMWARKPNDEGCFLYHTFSPDCDYYTVYSKKENESVKHSDELNTIEEVKDYIIKEEKEMGNNKNLKNCVEGFDYEEIARELITSKLDKISKDNLDEIVKNRSSNVKYRNRYGEVFLPKDKKETLILSVITHKKDSYDNVKHNLKEITRVTVDCNDLPKAAQEIRGLIDIAYACYKCSDINKDEIFEALIGCESSDDVFEAFEIFSKGDLSCASQDDEDEFDSAVEEDIRFVHNIPKDVPVKGYCIAHCLDYDKIRRNFEIIVKEIEERGIVHNVVQTFLDEEGYYESPFRA